MPLPVRKDYFTMTYRIKGRVVESLVMTSITEKEENDIDDEKSIVITRGDIMFTIHPRDIECYGEINFNKGSDDYDKLAMFPWLDHLTIRGVSIPSRYNYDKHSGYRVIPSKYLTWIDTTCPEKLAQYAHGFIGKPNRVVIFKRTTNRVYNGNNRLEEY